MTQTDLLLVDGHAAAFNSWYSSYPHEVAEGFIYMLDDLVDRHRPSHAVIAFDPPPPVFRHLLYPPYKEGRPPVPREFLDECEDLKQWLEGRGYALAEVEGYEADDTIGTLATRARRKGMSTVIATCDLDLLQLVNDRTTAEVFSQYWPTRQFDVEKTTRRFNGLVPSQIPDYKALAGDKTDNLPGVPGIGDVTATALLAERESLQDIYKDLSFVGDIGLRGAKRTAEVLDASRDLAFLMKKMTTIVCDVQLELDPGQSVLPPPVKVTGVSG